MKHTHLFLLLLLTIAFSGCKKNKTQEEPLRVFIIGNSITHHAPNASVDWHGNWGMAASVADSDYVHILTRKFIEKSANADVSAINLSEFENGYWEYDLNRLDTLLTGVPDLVILRIGENVNKDLVVEKGFKNRYLDLINYLKGRNNEVKIICSPGFWKNPPVEDIIKECSVLSNSSYVEISVLDEPQYMAWGLFSNPGVAAHPGNKGMRAIADLLWEEVEVLLGE